jgi:DHA2 family multidrug resistance protein
MARLPAGLRWHHPPPGSTAVDAPTAWLGVIGVIIAGFVVSLDTQVCSPILGDIAAGTGATLAEGSWVTTAYLIAEVAGLPLSPWLSKAFGMRRLMAGATLCFLVASTGCGMAGHFGAIIAWRAVQGLAGGIIFPCCFAVVRTHLPPAMHHRGLALFGFILTVSPAVGPKLAGVVTGLGGWSWVFFLNWIPGLAVIAMVARLASSPIDWAELGRRNPLSVVSLVGCLTLAAYCLEQGGRKSWFASADIVLAACLAVICAAVFCISADGTRRPLLELPGGVSRSTVMTWALGAIQGSVQYGIFYVIPLFLIENNGYDASRIGTVVIISGIPQLLLYPMMPRLMRACPDRGLMAAGAGLMAISCFLNTGLTAASDGTDFLLPQILRGIGYPLFAAPLSGMVTRQGTREGAAHASSIFVIIRTIAGAIMIVVLTGFLDAREQFHVERFNHAAADTVSAVTLHRTARRDAVAASFADSYRLFAWLLCASVMILIPSGRLGRMLRVGEASRSACQPGNEGDPA